ncbi:glycosyltransferase family 2 protein [Pedobacter sp. BS3]|uniref:glycosyltransferase family 2 protein n=1 Tax=Pedobacter sp. BS3 TaxID=2567937 RepID=UPI0011EF6DA6|nr:glycosyltransferase family 2 protein [Pedobacter sp. BS3]TZF84763.1 glycosyltransferase family 2 protein [Pedobacter sp. BS3]
MKKISVITVNYNQPQVTEELLSSIFSVNTYPAIEIIVADNGSDPDITPAWRNQYPSVHFIRLNTNLGFAGGNNAAIQHATGDYIFMVNNDTEFTPGLIETLIAPLENNSKIAVISPKIRYYQQPNTIQYIGFTPMNYYTIANNAPGQFEIDTGQYDNICAPTGYAHGAAMMIRASAMHEVGLMAENFFLYYEEMDWCDRFKRAGYEIWVNTNALIYHKESVSVGARSALKEYFMNRNRILFARRNAPLFKQLFFFFYFLLLVTPRNIIRYCKEKNYNFIGVLFRAIWWNVSHSKNSMELGYKVKS